MGPSTLRYRDLILVILLVGSFAYVFNCKALTETFWVDGTITTAISEIVYDTENYYVFNFTVSNTNGSKYVTIGDTIQVGCWDEIPESLGISLEQGTFYNFSGAINDVQVDEFPLGWFKVSDVNVQGGQDWWTMVLQFINILSTVTKGIAETIANLINLLTGFQIAEIWITLAMIALLAWFVIKNVKALSIVFVIVILFLIVSGGANVIRLMFFG